MDLQKRVGKLVARHRRERGLTQQRLSEKIGMSPDMISKIETGGTGVRFSTIEKLSHALNIDPAELFIVNPVPGRDMRPALIDLTVRLSQLSDTDLVWVSDLLRTALRDQR